MKTVSILSALLFCFSNVIAQTGPGGVGNTGTNGFWLTGENAVVGTWTDISGNGNNAVQSDPTKQPSTSTSTSLNGMPVVVFDGTTDEMAIPDADILDGTTGITFYSVIRPTNLSGAPRGILGKRIAFNNSANYSYTWFLWTGNLMNTDINTSNNRFSSSTAFANNTDYIWGLDYDGTFPQASRTRMYSQGVKVGEGAETSTSLISGTADLAIGALNVNYNQYLGGEFAEMIHFNYSLDSAEHIIVQNYLAAKYNISLTANDLYVGDDPANGDHDFDVAGIGQVDAMNNNLDAIGSGQIQINNATDLNDDEFLIWGHDNGYAGATNTSDIPAGVEARFERTWYFSEVNGSGAAVDVGAVDITIDLSEFSPINAADLRLLVDNPNGMFADDTPIAGAIDLGGGRYQFAGVTNIVNGALLTIGTANINATPLPVELTNFEAERNTNNEVEIRWTTASEFNNDFFALERSSNGLDWQTIATISGAGTTNTSTNYTYTDTDPNPAISFYRLAQTDIDGTVTYSKVIAVSALNLENLLLYPNPATEQIVLLGKELANEDIQVFGIDGTDQSESIEILSQDDSTIILNVNLLSSGWYVVQIGKYKKRFLKK
ncbi:MAG: T9SS type A sorting domain-containing protein [Saprospiraceae bacterium]|nr:T9SS type A sorting domain-containing protein [Saprospiraceae bacterium]